MISLPSCSESIFLRFGGGFASVPLMFHEIVEVRSWMNAQTFLNGIALGQITPGPIVITATFAGYIVYGPARCNRRYGERVFAVLHDRRRSGAVFFWVRNSIYFTRVIRAVLCSFVGLLLTVTFRFALNISWDISRVLLAAVAFVALLFKVEIVWIVFFGRTVISVFYFLAG